MIDKHNNPWLGLSSYQTSDSFRFFGREREMEEIGASIKDNYCTILYGVSGAGKTSIINAGLCPKLSAEGYLPITIRLDHNGQSYSDQIISACFHTFEQTETEYECPFDAAQIQSLDARDALWIFFHASTFWSKDNRKIVPVLFIDQFEEIFTLTGSEDQTISFFQQIDSLFGSVPSDRLILQLESSNTSFDFSETPQFRMVLSMREDFLARLEDYCYNLPILRRNRIGLRKMNGFQALDVIMKPQRGLVAEDVALKIVSTVTGKDCSSNRTNLQMLSVDTSILSLFCSELYQLSAEKNADVITSDIVETEGGDIIKRFYEKNVSKLSRRGRRYLEQHLLTSGGFRNQLAVEDINRALITESDIQALESARIIRKEIINGTERIEFTHDILCKAAMKSMRKDKKRGQLTTSIISYISFAFLTLFMSSGITNLFIAISDFGYVFTSTDNSLSIIGNQLLKVIIGFMFVPICGCQPKQRNIWISVFLFLLYFFINLYFQTTQIFYFYTDFAFIVVLINIFSKAPRVTTAGYFKSLFNLSTYKQDGVALTITKIVGIWTIFRIMRHLSLEAGAYSGTGLILAVLPIIAISTVLLYFIVCSFIPCSEAFTIRKKLIYEISLFVVVYVFFLTQFCHPRIISALCLGVLIALIGVFERKKFITLARKKRGISICLSSSAILLLFLCPYYAMGLNIFSLKDNIRCLDNNKVHHTIRDGGHKFITIQSKSNEFGIIERNDIIVPPIFDAVRYEDFRTNRFLWKEYNIGPNSEKISNFIGSKRLGTVLSRLTSDYVPYFYVWRNLEREEWDVLSHPQINNRYSRALPELSESLPDDTHITQACVEYFFCKIKAKNSSYWRKKFDSKCEWLFIRNYYDYLNQENHESYDIIKKSFLDEKADFIISIEKGPIDFFSLEKAIDGTLLSNARYSKSLIDNLIQLILRHKGDGTGDALFHRCLAKIYLYSGKYDDAINEAICAKDTNVISAARLLMDDIEVLGDGYSGEVLNYLNILGSPKVQSLVAPFIYGCHAKTYEGIEYLGNRKILRIRPDYCTTQFYEGGKLISEFGITKYPEHGDYGVYFQDGKRGYLDRYGRIQTRPQYDHAWFFSNYNELAVVEVEGMVGFIDTTFNYVIQPSIPMIDERRYAKDWIFDKDSLLVFPGSKGKYGLINSSGNWVVSPVYEDIGIYQYGFRVFSKNGDANNFGMINSHGEVVIQPVYKKIEIDSEYIFVHDNTNITTYRHNGNKILEKID